MRRTAGVLILIIFLFMVGMAVAGPVTDGLKAYQAGDYKTVYRLLKPLAEQGDATAQTYIGILYEEGLGVPKDNAEAIKWYRKAADQGDDHAQYNLGLIYFYGQGVQQDYFEAAKWFKISAEQGVKFPQFELGLMYLNGQGVTQDYALAVKWFRRSANQGYGRAQQLLGMMYLQGKGIPQDYVLAHMWLNLGATYLPASEQGQLETTKFLRDRAEKKMTKAQIAKAQRMAQEWKPKVEW